TAAVVITTHAPHRISPSYQGFGTTSGAGGGGGSGLVRWTMMSSVTISIVRSCTGIASLGVAARPVMRANRLPTPLLSRASALGLFAGLRLACGPFGASAALACFAGALLAAAFFAGALCAARALG